MFRSGKALAADVSSTLDSLLDKGRYNKEMRPPGVLEDKHPITVSLNLAIRSMGPVDEVKNVFSLDCYFRQSWMDKRLRWDDYLVTIL